MAYSDSYENDNTSGTSKLISIGSTQTHSLPAGDVDWVYFDVTTPGTYTIETTGSGDTLIYLYNSSLSQLEYDDDDGDALNGKITRTLSAGRYYLEVAGCFSTTAIDTYGIKLSSVSSVAADSYENDNSRFTAKTIAVGTTQNHTIHSSTDEDWVKFTVSADGFYSVITSGGDTVLQLYSFEGQAFGYNDDRGNGDFGSAGVTQLYANTTYYARVTAYGGDIINYSITVAAGVVADAYESNSDGTRTGTTTTIDVNSAQVHTIHNSSDVDWIKVNITEAGVYMFMLGTSERDAGQMSLQLYDSSGNRLTVSSCQKESGENPFIGGTISTPGTYYLRAAAANAGTVAGEYAVYVSSVTTTLAASADDYEDDGWYENAASISVGEAQTRSLNVFVSGGEYCADTDWIKFTPTVTGTYRVAVSNTTAPARMTVYAADETGAPFLPTGGSSKINPFVENYMQAGQTYYIRVQSEYTRLNIDSYTLGVTLSSAYTAESDAYESDNTPATATTITAGTSQAHSIHVSGDTDWLKFTPTASGYYTFYTGARNGNAGDADMMLGLYDSSGTLLIYDDDSFSAYNAMLSYNMTAGETYYLVALAARDGAVVPYYTVSLASGIVEDTYDIYMDERSVLDNTRENAIQLSVGVLQAHTIHSSSDVDWVGFIVDATGYYTLQTGGSGDTILSIYDADGNFLVLDDDSGVGHNASVSMQFTAGEVYYAKVSAFQNALIPYYTLSLTETSGGSGDAYESDNTMATAKGIVAGETQSHSIHAAGDVDWVKIRPLQGGTYQIQTSGNGDLKLDLYSANGTLLATDDDSGVGLNARIGYTLNANTDYYIKAYTYNTSVLIDSYGLSVALMVGSELGDEYESDNIPTAAKPITLGETQSHSIHIEGDVDWVTFTPTVSAEYTIQTIGSGLNCDTQLYLYTSLANAQADNYLQWDDDSGADRNALISRVLTAGTTYYIKAQAWSTYTIPSYGLKVTQNNGAGSTGPANGDEYETDNQSGQCKPIAIGRTYTHNIHVQSDTDWVRFFTHQTGTYTIQTTGDADMSFIVYKRIPGGALVPYESGAEIINGGAGQNALYQVTLEADNWYYVRITTNGRLTTASSYGIRVDIDSNSVSGDQFETMGGKPNDNAPSRANWLTLGYSQIHSIHTPGDTDWVCYKAGSSAEIVFSAENEESKEMRLFLYRLQSDGSLAYLSQTTVGSYGYTAATLSTTAGGIYYIRAEALSDTETITSYSLVATYVKDEYEDDNTSSKATTLAIGVSQTHNIHSQFDEDWYKIVIATASTYEFETSGSGDTYGILYRNSNGANTVVTSSGTGGTGDNMKITTSLEAGTYYLRITGEGQSLVESYSITARRPITQYDEPNDTQASATTLALNTTKTGSFHSSSDVDYFKIAAGSAGTYTLTASSSAISVQLTVGSQTVSGTGSASITLSSGSTVYAKLYNAHGDLMDNYTVRATYSAPVVTNEAENFVVYFAGGVNISNNTSTFYLNMKDIYAKIMANYDVDPDHVYILYADGTNTGLDSTNAVTGASENSDMSFIQSGTHVYSATSANLTSVFNTLKNTDYNDHLFVYVEDHGSGSNSSSVTGEEQICCWGSGRITGADFASMVSGIGAGYQTYLFAQCYSGGILNALNISRISSSTAKVYGAAATSHYDQSNYYPSSTTGEEIAGFVYQTRQALNNEVNNTANLASYLITNNPFAINGYDDPYYVTNTPSGFQIFAQS